jgi:DNA modification methylase
MPNDLDPAGPLPHLLFACDQHRAAHEPDGSEERRRGAMNEVINMPPGAVMGSEFILPSQRNWGAYEKFLARKRFTAQVSGLDTIPTLNSAMFPHQHDVTAWALRLGKSAAFLGTGMGKSLIELEWARIVSEHSRRPVILLAPLAVAFQMITEAHKFGIEAAYCRDESATKGSSIVVTNYERLGNFTAGNYAGVVLDESSILKSFDGKTRTALIDAFRDTPYRLAATATPAPNDHMELGNHAEFLGVMTATEMLSMFFTHDGGETQKWRLKGHARKEFWKWVCSWAVNIRKPSDVGYDDGPFILPPLHYHEHTVSVDKPSEGMLFAMPAETLGERLAARRSTVDARVSQVASIVNSEPAETWLIWTNLNKESESIARTVGAVEVTGSDDSEYKAKTALDFAQGKIQRMVSKADIFGWGVNWQICSHAIFAGVTDSWEKFFQAVRRNWRFGQTCPVHIHIIAASTEGNVLENLKRKEKEAEQMAEEMQENMQDLTRMNLHGTARTESTYQREATSGDSWTVHLADCVELARELPENSVHYSIYSPPFQSLYTYSNSERDMGNSKDGDEFWQHYKFLIAEQYRALMPGRLVSIHCMNLPTSKTRDGIIGIRDFRGEIIRAFEEFGFIYHSEVSIWKDPVTAMQRTKALGLLHKQIKKDACMSRQGIPDYLCTFRKPGDNPERVTNTNDSFPVKLWQNFASPHWDDINPSDTLQYRSAREHNDERHICPLQLEVIRRAIKLWTNPGDMVWSPFAGIGSEGFVALEMGRRFIGSELKPSYYRQACRNMERALSSTAGLFAESSDDTEDDPIEQEVSA